MVDDNTDIFAAPHLVSYYCLSSLILPSIVMISFYILSKRLFLKCKGLSDARVVSFTFFLEIHKVFKVNIWWMIKRGLLNLLFVWSFNKKNVYFIAWYLLVLWYKVFWIKTVESFSFFFLMNSSVTVSLSFFDTNYITNHIIKNY